MIGPTLDHAIAFNRSERREDEWFDESDDLDRVQRALDSIADIDDVVEAAAVLAYRVARAQGFGEGNKRTALLLARWLLDHNGEDGLHYLPLTTGSSPTCSSPLPVAGTSSRSS